ncbi:MAG: hypothetical protein RIS52_2445, partial [Pseudomonadota bacterium]
MVDHLSILGQLNRDDRMGEGVRTHVSRRPHIVKDIER